jgi:hypothetical protein
LLKIKLSIAAQAVFLTCVDTGFYAIEAGSVSAMVRDSDPDKNGTDPNPDPGVKLKIAL